MYVSWPLASTPVADMIKGAWLDILYHMDVFYVITGAIATLLHINHYYAIHPFHLLPCICKAVI